MAIRHPLYWQSKLVLLLVVPTVAADIVLQAHWWAANLPAVALSTLALSLLLGFAAWKLGTATPGAAAAGAAIAASITFSTSVYPYATWNTALVPLLTLLILTSLATQVGRSCKEELGIAEPKRGRSAAQVVANLGVAALAVNELVQSSLLGSGWFAHAAPAMLFVASLAALAESAADTVSSEIGQVLGGIPRMVTTLRQVRSGTDGGVTLVGTLSGIAAAALVALAGALALRGGFAMFWIACAGGVFGLFFDSLLGATLERKGWLNNDAVNFLSTASAAVFALGLLALR